MREKCVNEEEERRQERPRPNEEENELDAQQRPRKNGATRETTLPLFDDENGIDLHRWISTWTQFAIVDFFHTIVPTQSCVSLIFQLKLSTKFFQ